MPSSTCRVCGWNQDELPWGDDGLTPSFEICDCCGVQFGYEDCTPTAISGFRKKWIDSGAKWFNPDARPLDWSLEVQLKVV